MEKKARVEEGGGRRGGGGGGFKREGEMGREKMEKKARVEEGGGRRGGGGGGCSSWEGMSPEVLALIFLRIPADEILRNISFVCRSWRDVVAGPYCWSEIDLEQWCRRVNRTDIIDAAVRKLVRRSRGTLFRLSAYRLGNSGFSCAASSGRCLKVLQIPMSEVTDKMVEKHAESLRTLKVLDISYCLGITSKGIEVLGKSCKSLVHLRRNMPPPDIGYGREDAVASKADEDEALVVANTMPGLEHLQLAYGRFSDQGLIAILSKCKSLHFVDIRGCWSVKMEGNLEDECLEIKNFIGPWDDVYDDVWTSDEDGEDNADDGAGIVDVDTTDESDDD